MIGNYSARLTGSKRNLLALLASSVIFSAGCANMASTAPEANPFSSPASLSGTIHGGNQPVTGATVNLWFAGQSGPALLAATTTTDGSGTFSFTKAADGGTNSGTTKSYSCPTSIQPGFNPLVYVISRGGDTQNNGVVGQTNTAAAFIAIYGTCNSLTAANSVYMSEVTTVATMAAVQQFYNPANDNITADGTGQQKTVIINLPTTIALLANATTGLSVPSTVIPAVAGDIPSTVSVTATPEPGKVNLLANIISACVNGATSAAPACGTLFSAAVPPAANTTNLNGPPFPAATDTLQALFYIFTNPTNGAGSTGTNNLTSLFGLAGGVGAPYQPSAAKPTDWTIAINYASTGTSSNCASGNFISGPVDINIDAVDNVWFANSQTGGNLSALALTGAPQTCVKFDAGSSSGGGVVDSVGNVWFGAGTTMYRYNPTARATVAFPVAVSPLGITADGAGNVFFTAVAGSVGSLYWLPAAATLPVSLPVQISNLVGPNPMRLMADATSATPKLTPGSIWVSSGSTFISQVTPTTTTGATVLNGFLTNTFTTSGNSYGVSISRTNNIFTSSIDNGAIDLFAYNSTAKTWSPAGTPWPFVATTAGISIPTALATDGGSKSWIPNHGASSVSELSFFGVNPLSPATGFVKDPAFLNSNRALAIDQAGNVWIAGDGNNFLTEIVGEAVPVYAPYAVGINNGRYQQVP
jgi:hypothetical protein